MRILGIDPGTATVGYGLVAWTSPDHFEYLASGTIQTPKTLPAGARLKMIREDLASLLDEYLPDVLAVESLFFFKNAKTVIPVAQARGVILEIASHREVPVSEYTPMQVKLNLTGFGRAEKRHVQEFVARLFGLADIIRPDDASDALAIAVCHARTNAILTRVTA